jgi:hypothetical protein
MVLLLGGAVATAFAALAALRLLLLCQLQASEGDACTGQDENGRLHMRTCCNYYIGFFG